MSDVSLFREHGPRRCDRVISISDAVKKSKLEKEPEFLNKTLEQYQNHIDGLIGPFNVSRRRKG
jgi:hypothetical protein